MDIYVKNMVCPRCITAVESLLNEHGIPFDQVELGHIHTLGAPSAPALAALSEGLRSAGFALVDDKKQKITEQIKGLIVQTVHHSEGEKENLSELLRTALDLDYKYLSAVFSEVTGTTIEKFYIRHRIERVKELLAYDELSLKEIAFQMGYSSEAYLSNQFKKVCGITPSAFKKSIARIPLDQL
jgi:AraC family transcriptional regulator